MSEENVELTRRRFEAMNRRGLEGSGAPIEDEIRIVSRFRDAKVVWWQTCGSERDALETAGVVRAGHRAIAARYGGETRKWGWT